MLRWSLLACLLLFGVGCAGAAGGRGVALVSRCGGQNAEVEQAVDGSHVYETWIGCQGKIGFASSTTGGKTFGAARVVPGSQAGGWDPAVAVAPDGTVYVAFMVRGPATMVPVVAVSRNHGRSFARSTQLPVPTPDTPKGNWGDRDFITVGPDGAVYVTWDYGPRRDEVRFVCAKGGSCAYAGGDFNGVVQASTDQGKTWTKLAPFSPGFPTGGVYSAPVITGPDGALDVLYLQHPTDQQTLDVSPGHEYFTRSTDGGKNWSTPVAVGSQAGTISDTEWWVDGALAVDPAGTLYAAWDTQSGRKDTAWLAWSVDDGQTWTTPLRVISGSTERLVEVAAVGPGDVYVAWQSPIGAKGYAVFARRYVVGHGWTSAAEKISPGYGNVKVWPGDTFGLSTRGGSAIVSWGGATQRGKTSEIRSTTVTLPAH